MKAVQVVCLVVVFIVAFVKADLKSDHEASIQECIKKFNLSPDILTKDKSLLEPTEDFKCFAKCTVDASGVVSADGELDVDKMVAIAVSYGLEDSKVRPNGEKCKSLFKANSSCDESFLAYRCANGF